MFGVGAFLHQVVNSGVVGQIVIVPGFAAGEFENGLPKSPSMKQYGLLRVQAKFIGLSNM
ncbi:MAG: hypothetical protein LBK41_08475 [Clostridiales bacterium]|nr:hypothetical protein [Clostridiales bacterium]